MKIKGSENIYKYLDIAGELKKLWNMRVEVISIVLGALGMISKDLGEKKTIGIGDQSKNRDHPDHSTVKIG